MQQDDAIQAARGRLAEQLLSDERILGAVPEDAARLLLDRALAALDAAVTAAPDTGTFTQTAEAIRRHARDLADTAAAADDPAVAIAASPFPVLVTAPEQVAAQPPAAPAAWEEPPPPEMLGAEESSPSEAPLSELAATEPPHLEEPPPIPEPPSLWERLRLWWR